MMVENNDVDKRMDVIGFPGLQDGGHLCTTGCRPIVMCELGLSPTWCPKPTKYQFVEKCKKCKLYLANDCMHLDYDKLADFEDVEL